jgi:phage gp36-like protein
MAYATLEDLKTLTGERELVQLTDRAEPPSGEIDEAVAQAALDWADDQIDSHVSAAYRLPLPSPPPRLMVGLACDLARYRLHGEAAPERVKAAHDQALAHLARIARGAAKIPDLEGRDPPSRDGVTISAGRPTFDDQTMAGF